jgi:transcription elongation factor/antiterminator RfaH
MRFEGAMSPGSPGVRWYAVQARVGREHIAVQHLERQNFATFCAMRRKIRKIGRHEVASTSAYFPGYVFVQVDTELQRWRSINGTVGVIRIVSFGGDRPTPLPAGFVEQLQNMSGDNSELRFREDLSAGDRVRVIGGPFDDLCGTLETAGDHERVIIMLDLLSQETRVRVTRGSLIAA